MTTKSVIRKIFESFKQWMVGFLENCRVPADATIVQIIVLHLLSCYRDKDININKDINFGTFKFGINSSNNIYIEKWNKIRNYRKIYTIFR